MIDHPIERVLPNLEKVRPNGDRSWMACCPAHEDRTPSLSISAGDDGRVLLNCFAGCGVEAVLAALGLELSDLYVTPAEDARRGTRASQAPHKPPRDEPTPRAFVSLDDVRAAYVGSLGEPSASWTYRDPAGEVLGVVFRWETPNGKTIRPAFRFPDGWRQTYPPVRPLYGLEQIAGEDRVFVVEGEKAAERLHALGFPAVTSAGGSKAAGRADWSALEASEVVVLPDADDAGEAYAADVVEQLARAGREVVIARLPKLRPQSGDDVVEWIDDVHAGDEVAAAGRSRRSHPMPCGHIGEPDRRSLSPRCLTTPPGRRPPEILRTGVPWYDDVQPFGGIERGTLTVLAAPPRCFKTSMMLFLAWQLAAAGHRVHYLAGEMTRPHWSGGSSQWPPRSHRRWSQTLAIWASAKVAAAVQSIRELEHRLSSDVPRSRSRGSLRRPTRRTSCSWTTSSWSSPIPIMLALAVSTSSMPPCGRSSPSPSRARRCSPQPR